MTNALQSVNAAQQGDVVIIKMVTKMPLTALPNSFSVANPGRIAIDLPVTANALGRNTQAFNEGALRSANFVQAADKTRVVLNLNRAMTYEMHTDGNMLLVRLSPAAQMDSSAAQVTHFSAPSVRAESNVVRDIGFRRGKDGEGRITVDLSESTTGIDIRQQGGSLIVDFAKTALPERLRKRMDVTDFATPVTEFSVSQLGEMTRLTIKPKGLWEHNAYQTDGHFVIEIKPIIENPNKLVQGSRGGYQGERLSLNFQNVDVRRLLQVIGEFTGMNVVVSDTVGGSITLILKDVPWDQALDIIMKQRDLDMRKNGNVILIAPREEIATKEKLEFESRQQIDDLEPTHTESFQLNYAKAETVQKLLTAPTQRILSKRGSAVVDERTNMLFVQDMSARLDDVRMLIAKVDVPVRQVMIEARIVEASDNFNKDLGARLGFNTAAGGAYKIPGGQVSIGGGLNSNATNSGQNTGLTPALADSLMVNMPAQVPTGMSAGVFSTVFFNTAATRFLNLEISALEADGRGKIISSPRVVTADQIEAVIEQGTDIPYQSTPSIGVSTVSFRKANLALKVKPSITPDGKITMMIDIEKDTPNLSLNVSAGLPIDTKHIKTEVLIENGGTVVIGGIYQDSISDSTSRVPLLGDIPYLGWLFKSTTRSDTKTELLIFITPKVMSDAMLVR